MFIILLYSNDIYAEQILGAAEVTQLFSGQTYEASLPDSGIAMTVYADPDGTMRGIQNGKIFTSNWKVNEKGEMCVRYQDKTSCRAIINDGGWYKKYKLDEQDKRILLVVYKTFTPGNIYGF